MWVEYVHAPDSPTGFMVIDEQFHHHQIRYVQESEEGPHFEMSKPSWRISVAEGGRNRDTFNVSLRVDDDWEWQPLVLWDWHQTAVRRFGHCHNFAVNYSVSTASLTASLLFAAESARLLVEKPLVERGRLPVLLREPTSEERASIPGLVKAYEARDLGAVQPLLDLLLGDGLVDHWILRIPFATLPVKWWRSEKRQPVAQLVELGLLPGRRTKTERTARAEVEAATAAVDLADVPVAAPERIPDMKSFAVAIRSLFRRLKIPHLSAKNYCGNSVLVTIADRGNAIPPGTRESLDAILHRAFPANQRPTDSDSQYMGDMFQADWSIL